MIQLASAPPCGNAAAILVSPDPGALAWTLLRRLDDDFVGVDDDEAVVVASGEAEEQILDVGGLSNGTPYYYLHYCLHDDEWLPSGSVHSVTPAYRDQPYFQSPDVAATVRQRLDLGLRAELALQRIGHPAGVIPVLTAPPQIETARLPIVTVMLEQRVSEVRGVGELILPDRFEDALWTCHEGWLDRSTVQIIAWALNPDDRARLRNAIQRVLMLNLPIFDDAGLAQIDLAESEDADFESFNAPVYQSVFTFSCLHPAIVIDRVPPINHVESYPNGERPQTYDYSF